MNYLLLICTDGVSTPEIAAAMQEHMPAWVEEMDGRGIRLLGNGLEGRETARTVRVREGQTLISDGPFTDTKEFIGGLDIIEAESLDEAIEVAAKHPVSWYFAIEVRPFRSAVEVPEDWSYDQLRYLLMPCHDGIPEADDVEEQLQPRRRRPGRRWSMRAECACSAPRLRRQATRRPFASARARRCSPTGRSSRPRSIWRVSTSSASATLDEALELAQSHPLARFHMVEVRPFWGA